MSAPAKRDRGAYNRHFVTKNYYAAGLINKYNYFYYAKKT